MDVDRARLSGRADKTEFIYCRDLSVPQSVDWRLALEDRRAEIEMPRLPKSLHTRILAALITVGGMTVIVKGVTLSKEILIAHRFGANEALDAFYLALLLPAFLTNVIGDSINSAFVPIYIQLRETEGAAIAHQLLSSVAVISLCVLVVTSLLLAGLRHIVMPALGSGFSPHSLRMAESLFSVLLAPLAMSGLVALWRATLNAEERFAISAITPLMTQLAIMIVLLLFGATWGVYALVAGMVLGMTGELAVSGCALARAGIPLMPRWYGVDASLRRVLSQYAPMVAGALLMGSTVLVDQSMAAMLQTGSVSALNYAGKLLSVPLNIGVYSLSIAVFPVFSRQSASKDWRGMRRILSIYTRLILVVSLPLTIVLMMYSEQLVALMFAGGAFDADAIHLVGKVQALLCLQLPFFALGLLYVRAISALGRNQILMWGTIISVVANVLLNVVFMRIYGLAGIALSTAVVYALSCGYLAMMLFRTLGQRETTVASGVTVSSPQVRSVEPGLAR